MRNPSTNRQATIGHGDEMSRNEDSREEMSADKREGRGSREPVSNAAWYNSVDMIPHHPTILLGASRSNVIKQLSGNDSLSRKEVDTDRFVSLR